jgi:nitrite reductase/ring-hydroxylating ferredoxin subunit
MSKPFRLDVNPQLECAETLASRYYTDPAMLALEKERIFRRQWQLVGTLSQSCGQAQEVKRTIADPETYFTFDVAGEPVVVTRDKAGTLRAFSNVCRHRAGPIAQDAGCKHVLNCAYHGWTYTLDGRLIGTPEIDGVEFFDRSTMGWSRCAAKPGSSSSSSTSIRKPRHFANFSATFPSRRANSNSKDWPSLSAATTSSTATGRTMSTIISTPTTSPWFIPGS